MQAPHSFHRRVVTLAYLSGILGFPFWLLSYAWLPFKLTGTVSPLVWQLIAASELCAMLLGSVSLIGGAVAMRTFDTGTRDRALARRALLIGILLWILIVVFNALGILWFW